MPLPPWLPPALAYAEEWLAYQMRDSELPGCALAVTYQGKLVLEQAFGVADQGTGAKLTPRHRFRVASHSKSFTAAAIMKLREQGRLKLDDPVGLHVEGLHPEIAQATIAQLLSHSAGIFRDGPDCAYWGDRAPFPNEARLRAELRLPPAIAPNTRFKYSNHGFALAGLVIEAVAGEPYAEYVQREIVDAAGLTETTPDVPLPPGAKFARGHSGRILLGRRVVYPGEASTHALAAATGFVGTAADLARFFAQLAPNAKRSVLSVASRREMARRQWRALHIPFESHYGQGTISGSLDGWEWFGHSGGFQGYITRTAVVPAQEIAVSVLTNVEEGLAGPWLDGVLHILKGFRSRGRPTRRAAGWAGRWWSAWGAIDLLPMGDRVIVAAPGLWNPLMSASEIEPTGPDEGRIVLAGGFASHGEPVRRVRGRNGTAKEFWLAGSRMVSETRMARELARKYD